MRRKELSADGPGACSARCGVAQGGPCVEAVAGGRAGGSRAAARLRRFIDRVATGRNLVGAACIFPGVAPLLGPPDALGTGELMAPAGAGSPMPGGRADRLRRGDLVEEVRGLLARLGDRPGDVADSLRRAGVRGDPADRARAPVTMFVSAVVAADPSVEAVSVEGAAVVVTRSVRWRATVRVAFPPSVATFAVAFEHGLYPALVAQAAVTLGMAGGVLKERTRDGIGPASSATPGAPTTS